MKKHIYSQKQKLVAVFTLVIAFIVILVLHVINSNHFNTIRASFESVYTDRLVVDDYIFRIARITEEKRFKIGTLRLDTSQAFLFDDHSYDSIDRLLEKYEVTKFSDSEKIYFRTLKTKLASMKALELNLSQTKDQNERKSVITNLNHTTSLILNDLGELSKIQIVEGKNLLDDSNKLVESRYLNSRLELSILIVICVIITALLTVNPLRLAINTQLSNMN